MHIPYSNEEEDEEPDFFYEFGQMNINNPACDRELKFVVPKKRYFHREMTINDQPPKYVNKRDNNKLKGNKRQDNSNTLKVAEQDMDLSTRESNNIAAQAILPVQPNTKEDLVNNNKVQGEPQLDKQNTLKADKKQEKKKKDKIEDDVDSTNIKTKKSRITKKE